MTYAALRLASAIVALLPAGARARLGRAVGFVAGSVLRIRRALVDEAMARAGVREPARAAAQMYASLGEGLVELLWLAGAPPPRRDAAIGRVVIDGASAATLDAACARGPVVMFASHTGNWELAAAAAAQHLAAQGRGLAVVAKAMHARGVDAFLVRLRRRLGVRVLAPLGAFGAARRALHAGDVVVMPIDQVPDRASHGVAVPFLCGSALADRAPAMLAWRAKATVLVVAAERDGGGHRVRLLDVIPSPARGAIVNPRAWIDATTRRATAALEAFVRRSPESWLWLHRRWRAPRSAVTLVETRQAS